MAAAHQRLKGDQTKCRGCKLKVADQQRLTLLFRPLALSIEQLLASHRPRAPAARVRCITRSIGVDAQRVLRCRLWKTCARCQWHALLLRQRSFIRSADRDELGCPPDQSARSSYWNHHHIATRAEGCASCPPRCVEPLPPSGIARSREVKLPQQLQVLAPLACRTCGHGTSLARIATPLAIGQREPTACQINAYS